MGVTRRTAQINSTPVGSDGVDRGRMCASDGVRLPLRRLHLLQAVTTLSQELSPPRDNGRTWSRVRDSR